MGLLQGLGLVGRITLILQQINGC